MELRRLRYFLAVAEELNVSRAARKLHIAQPPLSRQIQALEEEMGVVLFHRSHKQLVLTEAGHAFSRKARSVIEAAETAVAHAQRVQRLESGTLSVGFYEQIAYAVLPETVASFREHCPGIDVELKCFPIADQIGALEREEVDIAFVRPVSDLRGVSRTLLFVEPFVLAMRADHPLAAQGHVPLAQCAAYTLIGYAHEHAPDYHAIIAAACAAAGFTPNRPLLVGEVFAALGLASAGAGIALVPSSVQRVRFGGVVYRPVKTPRPMQSVAYLAWTQPEPSALLRSFMAIASEVAQARFASPARLARPRGRRDLEIAHAG